MRRNKPDLMKNWKVPINAELAGRVEFTILDPLTRKPRYGARSLLVEALFEHWLDTIAGKPFEERRVLPSLEELRSL